MKRNKIVIIGGSAAGAKAAARARRLDQHAQITIIQKSQYLSMASCGYPYYIGGNFDDRNMLLATPTGVLRDSIFFAKTKNIIAHVNKEVTSIDRDGKKVECINHANNESFSIEYDKLIICTGATPRIPDIAGNDLKGITTLHTMEDTDFLRNTRDERKANHVVIIGAGLIGVEACEALKNSGIPVTFVEMTPQILPFLDPQLSKLVENHLLQQGVTVKTSCEVESFLGEAGQLRAVKLKSGTIILCEVALLATGVIPNIGIAQECGLEIGEKGGISVDKYLKTSDPDIYSCGDCIEVKNIITGRNTLAPMGDLANLQGRVVGENILSDDKISYPGSVSTAICRVFNFTVGTTGISEQAATECGFTPLTVINTGPDKPGFMGSNLLISKMTIDEKSNKLLGFQCIGSGDVSRQVATAAMAIQGKQTLDDLLCLDLPYAPPYSTAIDHFICTAHVMENKRAGRFPTISAAEVQRIINSNEEVLFIDGRSFDEYEEMRLGIGEKLIPLGALRDKINELPEDKNVPIVCFCKISLRGYEAALILSSYGYSNVRVMEGGIMAWPYEREK